MNTSILSNINQNLADILSVFEEASLGSTYQFDAVQTEDGSVSLKLIDENTGAEQIILITGENGNTVNVDESGNIVISSEDFLSAAKEYTNTSITNLINSAPENLNTLGKLATAFEEHKEATDALSETVANKQNKNVIVYKDSATGKASMTATEILEKVKAGDNLYYTANLYEGTLHPYLEGSTQIAFFYSNYIDNTRVMGTGISIDAEGNITTETYQLAHLKDTTIHITAAEREKWNGIDLSNYYLKTETDDLLAAKANVENPEFSGTMGLNHTGELGFTSVSLGFANEASGMYCFSEGMGNKSTGDASHSEGTGNTASGYAAHAEGSGVLASETGAHAEGANTKATGYGSHAEGSNTIASIEGQHVEGKYNIDDPTSIHIVGNGTSDSARSNAHTLGLNGEAWFSGDIYTGSTSGTGKDEGSKKVATEEYVEALYQKLNSNTVLGFYCVEDVTIITNGNSKTYPANSNVEVAFIEGDVFEIVPTSNNSIFQLTAFPGALGTFYPWLEGVKQFSNILFDMNAEEMYTKWNQGNQGAYQVQYAQYANCIFWSDNAYISDVAKRPNYTLYYSAQLPLCYSTIPDNTFKSFYLAFNVNSDPNWGNKAYRDSFAKATHATQVFSYYGARTIGIFGHDNANFNITLPKDCRGLMYAATAIENAGTFDAANTTNFGAGLGSWREAFGHCSSLRNLYIKNLKASINISWSPINYDSIYFIISEAANTSAITISVSPYTYNLLSESDFELATSKNITISLVTSNYIEDRRLGSITELQTEVGKMIPTYYASWEESPTTLIDYAIYTEEEIPTDLEKYILMFHGWGGTTNDPVVTINDESYDIVGMDGNPLPEGAWTTGSLVTLNVDTVSKKAFFKLGSTSLDLSFVTAGAENIQKGFVGVDAEGNPVQGTLTSKKVQLVSVTPTIVSDLINKTQGIEFTITLDFVPDYLWIEGSFKTGSLSAKTFRYDISIYNGQMYGRLFSTTALDSAAYMTYNRIYINDVEVQGNLEHIDPVSCNLLTSEIYTIKIVNTNLSGTINVPKDVSTPTIMAMKF